MSTILQLPSSIKFDASNAKHRKAYVNFLNTGKWEIKFELEHPFTAIPPMVMFKLAAQACRAEGSIDEPNLFRKATQTVTESAKLVTPSPIRKVA
jgi:hypothetical protein